MGSRVSSIAWSLGKINAIEDSVKGGNRWIYEEEVYRLVGKE